MPFLCTHVLSSVIFNGSRENIFLYSRTLVDISTSLSNVLPVGAPDEGREFLVVNLGYLAKINDRHLLPF